MSNQNVNVEINKGAAGFAFLVCAISIGYAAAIYEFANPLVAGVIGGVVGFAISYIGNGYAALVLLAGAAIFALTHYA